MPSTFILTSSPFLLTQINLASFVPDVSQPHQDAKCPYTVHESDYFIQPDDNFTGVIKTSSESLLEILATRFAGIFIRRKAGNTFEVAAKTGKIYSLKSPTELFSIIMADEQTGSQTRRWLEMCKLNKLSPRFVVGYRTFTNADLVRGEHKSSGAGLNSTIPLSTISGDGTGFSDLSVRLGHQSDRDIQGRTGTPGERIYAISYRKVKVEYRKGVLATTLDRKTTWEPFVGGRSNDMDNQTYLEVEMSEGDDEQNCEVIEVGFEAENSVTGLRIGVLDDSRLRR